MKRTRAKTFRIAATLGPKAHTDQGIACHVRVQINSGEALGEHDWELLRKAVGEVLASDLEPLEVTP